MKKYLSVICMAALVFIVCGCALFEDDTPITPDIRGPVISGCDDISTVQGTEVSYRDGVSAVDDIDGDVQFEIDASSVDINTPGEYIIKYSAKDSSGNETLVQRTLTVTPDENKTSDENQSAGQTTSDYDKLEVTDEMIYALVDPMLASITKDGQSMKELGRQIYLKVRYGTKYVGHAEQYDYKKAAYIGFTTGKGDCYTYACESQVMLERAGFSAIMLERTGGITEHFWNAIDIGEGWYYFDACPQPDGYNFESYYFDENTARAYTRWLAEEGVRTNYFVYDKTKAPIEINDLGPSKVRLGVLRDSSGIGLVKILSDNDAGLASNNKYECTVSSSAAELESMFLNGELDAMTAPVNQAAILANKTNSACVLAVNTLGSLCIVEKNTGAASWDDLKGKTIYATDEGFTPEYDLRYLLSKNGIDSGTDVNIRFKSSAAEIVSLLETEESAIAMLPEPFASEAISKVSGLKRVFVLSDEWDKHGNSSGMAASCLMVSKSFAKNNPKAVKALLDEYERSAAFVNKRNADAAMLSERYLGIGGSSAASAVPLCNIVCIKGSEMKTVLSAYLSVMNGFNEASIGGSMPSDDFYYEVK